MLAERGWTNKSERTPRSRRPCYPEGPSATGANVARGEEWRYARSVVVQWRASLLADAQFLNDGFVALGIGLPEVIEQAATLAHHHEKTPPGGMVFLMGLKMFRQFTNPRTQDRNLHLRRTGIGCMSAVLVNQGDFFLSG